MRLAGLLSLFSFVVNYDPHLFSFLLKRVGDEVEGETERPRRPGG